MEINTEIRDALFLLQRRIFMDRGLWFFNKEELMEDEERESTLNPTGVLFVIMDKFIAREKLYKYKYAFSFFCLLKV